MTSRPTHTRMCSAFPVRICWCRTFAGVFSLVSSVSHAKTIFFLLIVWFQKGFRPPIWFFCLVLAGAVVCACRQPPP